MSAAVPLGSQFPPYHCDGFERDAHECDSIIVVGDFDYCHACYTAWKDARAVDDEHALLEQLNDARGG